MGEKALWVDERKRVIAGIIVEIFPRQLKRIGREEVPLGRVVPTIPHVVETCPVIEHAEFPDERERIGDLHGRLRQLAEWEVAVRIQNGAVGPVNWVVFPVASKL